MTGLAPVLIALLCVAAALGGAPFPGDDYSRLLAQPQHYYFGHWIGVLQPRVFFFGAPLASYFACWYAFRDRAAWPWICLMAGNLAALHAYQQGSVLQVYAYGVGLPLIWAWRMHSWRPYALLAALLIFHTPSGILVGLGFVMARATWMHLTGMDIALGVGALLAIFALRGGLPYANALTWKRGYLLGAGFLTAYLPVWAAVSLAWQAWRQRPLGEEVLWALTLSLPLLLIAMLPLASPVPIDRAANGAAFGLSFALGILIRAHRPLWLAGVLTASVAVMAFRLVGMGWGF